MILSYIQNISTAHVLLLSASKLATQLGKEFGVLQFVGSDKEIGERESVLSEVLRTLRIKTAFSEVCCAKLSQLSEICEKRDVSFLFLQLSDCRSKSIQQLLNACRDLRIPYLLYKDDFQELHLDKVILPVNFLEEEVEKAQFAAAFGRFCGSEIVMLLANDYGSKAGTNAERMQQLFDKFEFKYSFGKGLKDSFGIDKEAVQKAENENAGIVIVTASRDYGLDDVLFGPKEQHLVKKSTKPVLLINPRGDLYTLCD